MAAAAGPNQAARKGRLAAVRSADLRNANETERLGGLNPTSADGRIRVRFDGNRRSERRGSRPPPTMHSPTTRVRYRNRPTPRIIQRDDCDVSPACFSAPGSQSAGSAAPDFGGLIAVSRRRSSCAAYVVERVFTPGSGIDLGASARAKFALIGGSRKDAFAGGRVSMCAQRMMDQGPPTSPGPDNFTEKARQ